MEFIETDFLFWNLLIICISSIMVLLYLFGAVSISFENQPDVYNKLME